MSAGRRWFSVFLVLGTLFLIFAGAEVTSHEAGLSVPDWPLSYGMLWPPMVGNVFYEHGHRAIATTVGVLMVVLALWTARTERRAWVRKLGYVALAAVCVQGLLGGLTVIYLLPRPISMTHAALAQTFLCLTVWLAAANSRGWLRAETAGRVAGADAGSRELLGGRTVYRAALLATAVVFAQLILGAWVRHSEAGLAVPFFPVNERGAWLPDFVTNEVVIHMIHRGFAMIVAVVVLRAGWLAAKRLPGARGHGLGLMLMVLCQVFLGAAIVWTARMPVPTSLHVVGGAVVLALSWLLTLRAWRVTRHGSTGPDRAADTALAARAA